MRYYIGIDIGTQGARVVILSERGQQIIEKGEGFPLTANSREEQSPTMWWEVVQNLLRALVEEIKTKIDLSKVKAVGVTSTSGTVIPLDQDNRPLHNALMYSDKRAEVVVSQCVEAAEEYFQGITNSYTGFNASSSLCKLVWFTNRFPKKTLQIRKWTHAADFITGKLCGKFGLSDETNSLKTGYDIFSKKWPEYIYERLPIKKGWLPSVFPAGTPIGRIRKEWAAEYGLSEEVTIVAGITDGGASQIAAGAAEPGAWNTTIGTTMVIKGVTRKPIIDPEGRLYNHRHPEGYFMPGGAGNTGADWVSLDFKEDLNSLEKEAKDQIPSGFISWPLKTAGERFPISAPQAHGFEPEGLDRSQQFVSNMEGVAYLERYAYEMIEGLSGEKVKAVYTAGGGSKSELWLKIRSNVLGLPIYKKKEVSGAVGAAILAASQTGFKTLSVATQAMTQSEKVVKPEKELVHDYQKYYLDFLGELRRKGYLK